MRDAFQASLAAVSVSSLGLAISASTAASSALAVVERILVARERDVGVGLEDVGLGRGLRQGGSAAQRGERQHRTKRPELPHRASPSGQ